MKLPHQFKVGDEVTVSLHTGRIVDAVVKAIMDRTDGARLQVDYGKDETASSGPLRHLSLLRTACSPNSVQASFVITEGGV